MGYGNGKGKVPRPPTSPPPLWLQEACQGKGKRKGDDEHLLMRHELDKVMKDKLEEAASGTEKRRQMLEEQNMPQIRKRAQGYTHCAGNNIKPDSLESGMCDHYHKWLAYARTFRASMELPPTGDMLAAAVGLLMEFEGK